MMDDWDVCFGLPRGEEDVADCARIGEAALVRVWGGFR